MTEEVTDAVELLARLEEIGGNKAGAFTLRSVGAVGTLFQAKLEAVIIALRGLTINDNPFTPEEEAELVDQINGSYYLQPNSPTTNGEVSEPPLKSEDTYDAGGGHAPASGSRDGSEILVPAMEAARIPVAPGEVERVLRAFADKHSACGDAWNLSSVLACVRSAIPIPATGEVERETAISAWLAGARAVHDEWAKADDGERFYLSRDHEPDFTEAAHDYVAALTDHTTLEPTGEKA